MRSGVFLSMKLTASTRLHKIETLIPISEYLKGQGRFRHLTDDVIANIQTRV